MSTDIDWTGTWETNYGKVVLWQTKNIVTGVYILKEGRIEGLAQHDMLSGQWSEAPSYARRMMQVSLKSTWTNPAGPSRERGGSSAL